MAVIPNGQGSNQVIVWDKREANQSVQNGPNFFAGNWPQRFAVGNPETNQWQNFVLTIPLIGGEHLGDLFCAGQTWLPDGRLFVAGGNAVYGNVGLPTTDPTSLTPGVGGAASSSPLEGYYYGSRVAAIWNPNQTPTLGNNFGWTFLPRMRVRRWYPSVTLLGNDTVLVSGGSETYPNLWGDAAYNTFEVFDLETQQWDATLLPSGAAGYPGPQASQSQIGEYPRQHLLTNNRVFMAGMDWGANRLWHDFKRPTPVIARWDSDPTPGVPQIPPYFSAGPRNLGASVLVPRVGTPGNTNFVMILGGRNSTAPVFGTELVNALATTPTWSAGPTMNRARHCLNAVLTPNGEVVAIGGAVQGVPVSVPSLQCEIYSAVGGWRLDAAQSSARGYHSTAALLRSGRICSGGGDPRSSDYEIYTPSYMTPPPGVVRPAFGAGMSTGLTTWTANSTVAIDLAAMPANQWVQRVVLMRPCSTTHHSDFDQRYVELAIVPPDDTVTSDFVSVSIPPVANVQAGPVNQVTALRGFYMLFLVSNFGYVSEGRWVRLDP